MAEKNTAMRLRGRARNSARSTGVRLRRGASRMPKASMNSNTDRITSTVRSTEVLVRDSINGVELYHPAAMRSTIRAMGAEMFHRVRRPDTSDPTMMAMRMREAVRNTGAGLRILGGHTTEDASGHPTGAPITPRNILPSPTWQFRRAPQRRSMARRTGSGTNDATSPPSAATSITRDEDTCNRDGSPGRNTVSTPVRERFMVAMGSS